MSKINDKGVSLQEMFSKQLQAAYKIELAKAEKCCESCRDRMLESQIYFEYGYTAALNDVSENVEKLVEALEYMILSSAGLSFYYRAPNTVGKFTEAELRTKISIMYDRQCAAEEALAEFKTPAKDEK